MTGTAGPSWAPRRELEHVLEWRLQAHLLLAALGLETADPLLDFKGSILWSLFRERRCRVVLDADWDRLREQLAADQLGEEGAVSMLADTPAPVTYLPSW